MCVKLRNVSLQFVSLYPSVLVCILSFGVYHITVMTVYISRCEIQKKKGENSRIIQVLNRPSSDFGLVENQMKMS